uniref:Photosystem II protein I n=1 Tax=Heterorhabditis bacteriophora TaxID=37862 RepID=A0A1I7X106_HETBA
MSSSFVTFVFTIISCLYCFSKNLMVKV